MQVFLMSVCSPSTTGPQMRAVPDDGFAFKGWYADKELTQKVSDANPYRHPMNFRVDTLYAKFQSERVYIYTRIKEVSFTVRADTR